jgi:hypothetical protein
MDTAWPVEMCGVGDNLSGAQQTAPQIYYESNGHGAPNTIPHVVCEANKHGATDAGPQIFYEAYRPDARDASTQMLYNQVHGNGAQPIPACFESSTSALGAVNKFSSGVDDQTAASFDVSSAWIPAQTTSSAPTAEGANSVGPAYFIDPPAPLLNLNTSTKLETGPAPRRLDISVNHPHYGPPIFPSASLPYVQTSIYNFAANGTAELSLRTPMSLGSKATWLPGDYQPMEWP